MKFTFLLEKMAIEAVVIEIVYKEQKNGSSRVVFNTSEMFTCHSNTYLVQDDCCSPEHRGNS